MKNEISVDEVLQSFFYNASFYKDLPMWIKYLNSKNIKVSYDCVLNNINCK